MGYRLMGRAHAAARRLGAAVAARAASQRGQGTVEYVALILLVAVVLAGVVAATKKSSIGANQIGETIIKKLKSALESIK